MTLSTGPLTKEQLEKEVETLKRQLAWTKKQMEVAQDAFASTLEHGNEYAIVCHYKEENEKLRAENEEYQKKFGELVDKYLNCAEKYKNTVDKFLAMREERDSYRTRMAVLEEIAEIVNIGTVRTVLKNLRVAYANFRHEYHPEYAEANLLGAELTLERILEKLTKLDARTEDEEKK